MLDLIEAMMTECIEETLGVSVAKPFLRMSYAEAMERYGSDKPDIRFGMEIVDIGDIVKDCDFRVFRNAIEADGKVSAIVGPGCSEFSRQQIKTLEKFVKGFGAAGLMSIAVARGDNGKKTFTSQLTKFITEEELQEIAKTTGAEDGDLILIVAGPKKVVLESLGRLRLHLGAELDLIPEDDMAFLWVTEFPLFEFSEEGERIVAVHHPFTSPLEEDLDLMEKDPLNVRADIYDLVLNGVELGSGSIRIHRRDVQERVFRVLGLSQEDVREKFGFLLDAFEYGAPRTAGLLLALIG